VLEELKTSPYKPHLQEGIQETQEKAKPKDMC